MKQLTVFKSLQLAFEDCFSPVPAKKTWLNKLVKPQVLSKIIITFIIIGGQCVTSTSCMDTTSTPTFFPLSTISISKVSMTMMVLRTELRPFSRFCSSVSAFFWLSQSTVEISADRKQISKSADQ